MKNQIPSIVVVAALLVGCSQDPATTAANVVSERELATFLEQVKSGDFHNLVPASKALLKEGLLIPNYKTKLKDFPYRFTEEGEVRYELMAFGGDASAGGINLFLKEDTGEIICCLPFEVTF